MKVTMKLTQSKNYRKPLYAIGLAAAIAVTVTACGNEPVQLAGDTAGPETTESTTMLFPAPVSPVITCIPG